MSGEPQDFDKLLRQFGEFETCVSQGLRRVPQRRWQEWIGHSRTGEVTRLFYEMGPEAALVKLGLQELPTPLFRGLYRTIQRQAACWREWLPALKISADLDAFLAKREAPEWSGNRLTAVTLTLRGPSAAKEFQLYWPLIKVQQKRSLSWDKFNSKHVRWLNGSENTAKDWHFEWQVIDLGANRNMSSETVLETETQVGKSQPNAGILAAAALHPEWIKSMDGQNIPYVYLPGYEVSVPGYDSWQYVPGVDFARGDGCQRQVGLSVYGRGRTNPWWAVPSLAGMR